jgi:site-specific recombinase XerD
MHENSFAVCRFENRNGVISWRVSGWLRDVRIRKNFKSKEEAAAEKAALEIKAEQATSGLRTVTTCLLTEQVREAERGIISEVQVGNVKKELTLLLANFPDRAVSTLTSENLTTFCERGKSALKTYDNRRSILSTFFKFGFQKSWIVRNPVEKIPYYRIAYRRGTTRTLNAAQAQDLMVFGENNEEGRLVPFFALCLFAGIRPCIRTGEITKLKPKDINLDSG